MAEKRYCPKCDLYIPVSEVADLFHTVCHCRTVPQWSEERRRRLRAEQRITELEERIEALEQLLVCYRIGKNPSEALHRKLEKTKQALKGGK